MGNRVESGKNKAERGPDAARPQLRNLGRERPQIKFS